jgi:hypothetical protein
MLLNVSAYQKRTVKRETLTKKTLLGDLCRIISKRKWSFFWKRRYQNLAEAWGVKCTIAVYVFLLA